MVGTRKVDRQNIFHENSNKIAIGLQRSFVYVYRNAEIYTTQSLYDGGVEVIPFWDISHVGVLYNINRFSRK